MTVLGSRRADLLRERDQAELRSVWLIWTLHSPEGLARPLVQVGSVGAG